MKDGFALGAMRRGDERALELLIGRYGAYVGAVVRSILGEPPEDVEEVAADVFAALWRSADRPDPAKLKAYLGGIARNKAKSKLRERRDELPLDEDHISVPDSCLEDGVIAREERRRVKSAVLAMKEPDREIFLRHYYGLQTTAKIATDMGMSESGIKSRLARGREKLRTILSEEDNSRGKTNLGRLGLH